MRRYLLLLVLSVSLAVTGCSSNNNPLAPSDPGTTGNPLPYQPFVLHDANDSRLPAPMLEATGATAADWAGLRSGPGADPEHRSKQRPGDPSAFWNGRVTELANAARLAPPRYSRAYALTQIAIFDALLASEDVRRGKLPPNTVAAGAASVVLTFLFPDDAARINADANAQAELLNNHGVGARARGWALGRKVGRLVVEAAKTDGSDAVFTGPIPSGEGKWTGTSPAAPLAGTWRTWVLRSGDELAVEPPYAFGSRADRHDVEEIYQISLERTPEQIAIVRKWGDPAPPSIWNGMLAQRVTQRRVGAVESARDYAYLNVAMYDAFVSSWASKYKFWTARPTMRKPGLTTVIPTPNFPSYVSDHSTISGAASVVLGEIFPREQRIFRQQAEEAAMSRLWAGIHFRHDNDQGLALGRQVGDRVVRRMRHERPIETLALR